MLLISFLLKWENKQIDVRRKETSVMKSGLALIHVLNSCIGVPQLGR